MNHKNKEDTVDTDEKIDLKFNLLNAQSKTKPPPNILQKNN